MEKTGSEVYKRRNYFIDRKFQADFIMKFCALVCISGMLTIGILYLWAMRSTTVSIVNSRVAVRTTADFLLPLLIQTIIIVTVIIGLATIILTLLVSHKIAGPLYRFKKVIEALSQGDFSSDFHIRQLDQLQDMADMFNAMIKKTREELSHLRGAFVLMKEKLDGISEQDVSEHKRSSLKELKGVSEELSRLIRYFKT